MKTFLWVGVFAALFLVGCKKQEDAKVVAAGTALTVSSVSPSEGTASVPVSGSLVLTFSSAMSAANLTTNQTGTTCSGSVQLSADSFVTCATLGAPSLDATGDVATISYSALTNATTYKAKITTAATSSLGAALAADYGWSFITLSATTTATATTPATTATTTTADTTAPTSPSLSINAGALNATSATVTLNLSAADTTGVTAYYVSESSAAPTSGQTGWVTATSATAFSAAPSFTFATGGAEVKTVYGWFKDLAGNISVASSDTINHTVASGALDLSFSGDGIFTQHGAAGGANDFARSVAVDTNNKIWVAGTSTNVTPNNDMVVMRLDDNGVLDTTLSGGTGYLAFNNAAGGNSQDTADYAVLDANGNFVVGGLSIAANATYDATLWRLTPAGILDSTLNTYGTTPGIVTHANASGSADLTDLIEQVAVDATGKIVAAGSSQITGPSDRYAIWRFNNDGTLDYGFNSTGVLTGLMPNTSNSHITSLAIDANGKYVVAGYGSGTGSKTTDMFVCRFDATGVIDTTFNTNGCQLRHGDAGGTTTEAASGVVIASDGKIVVTGFAHNGTNDDMVLWRFNSNGTLDTTFAGTAGFVVHNSAAGGSGNDRGGQVAIDPAGNILVAGSSLNGTATPDDDAVVWRFTPAGILDTTFNTTGYHVVGDPVGSGVDNFRNITIDPKGRVLLSGESFNGTDIDALVIRLK